MRFKVDRARALEGVQNTEQRTSGLILFHFGGDRPPSVLARESSRDTEQMCVDACDLALIRVTSHIRTLCARKTDIDCVGSGP